MQFTGKIFMSTVGTENFPDRIEKERKEKMEENTVQPVYSGSGGRRRETARRAKDTKQREKIRGNVHGFPIRFLV